MRLRGLLAAAGIITAVCLLTGCSGSDNDPGVESKGAHLYQASPGDEPVIRMGWTSNIPDPSQVVAWLIYRGENATPTAERQNLIDVLDARRLPTYDDTRGAAAQVIFQRQFTYLSFSGQETGSLSATYDRPALVAGRRYYYRARRVVRTRESAPPIATAQATDFQLDPASALGEASAPQGPVTYILPPAPSLPSHGASSIDPRLVTFRWNTTAGADEYQVRVYDNMQAAGQPVVISPVQHPVGASGQWTYDTGGHAGGLRGNTTYYWVVGARRVGEATPTCGPEGGWLKSAVRQFRTATLPPPAP